MSDPNAAARGRIELTVACQDAAQIPKVPDAGRIVERDGRRVQIMHNGILVDAGAYHGGWMAEIIERLRGHHEPQEERVFHALVERCRPGGVMVELGSFWAYYAMWFLVAVPGARAVLVEPDANNLETGLRHMRLNGLEADAVLAAAVADEGRRVRLTRESDGAVVDVPGVTVDGLVARSGIGALELLLADTQGAELDVLAGARATIRAGDLRFVVLSTHHHTITGDTDTHARCLDLVRDLGGHVIAEHSVAESCSGDGLIAASFHDEDRAIPPVELSHAVAGDTVVFGVPSGEPPRPTASSAASVTRVSPPGDQED